MELFLIFKPLFQQKYFTELLKSKSLLPCRRYTSILLGEDSPLKWTQNLNDFDEQKNSTTEPGLHYSNSFCSDLCLTQYSKVSFKHLTG